MKFYPTRLEGSWLIEPERLSDNRGFFARLFCTEQFAEKGLETAFVQMNDSLSQQKGTLRGMHYQLAPKAEVKVVRCVRGAVFDVILDLRPQSATFGQWFGAELSAENRLMLYVPRGFAHGFLTLEEESELLYLVSTAHSPQEERGVRWDDPRFAIQWPAAPTLVSERDRSHPNFDPSYHLGEG